MMRAICLFFILGAVVSFTYGQATTAKVVCFYDSQSHHREDSGKYLTADLEHALSQCTHILYGSAKIDDDSYKVKSLDKDLDEDSGKMNFKAVTSLKKRFPGLQVLLSIGNWADKDDDKAEKYLSLIRDPEFRAKFVTSAHDIVDKYGFDGIDLGWQFPYQRIKERGTFSSAWHKVKKTFGYAKGSKDERADEHRAGWTALIKQLKLALTPDRHLLTVSAIPHTNYSSYWDPREISPHVDAIILQAFDYLTPEDKISPYEADYSAPLYAAYNRNPEFNVDSEVRWFLDHGAIPSKLVLGIPTYARTWKLTSSSAASGVPPIESDGPGAEGHLSRKPGILSFPEICTMTQNPNNFGTKGLLRKVTDPAKKFGTYSFRPEDSERSGIWASYDDIDSTRVKAEYAKKMKLGGVAIYDVSLDDFRGVCTGDRYPLLKAARSGFF